MSRGVAISGRLGTGKTWHLRELSQNHGVTIVGTVTTRDVEADDIGVTQLTVAQFVTMCRNDTIHMPMVSGGHYYGWNEDQFAIIQGGDRFCCSVRPYTALVLGTLVEGVTPVWLGVDEGRRAEQLGSRAAIRDLDPVSSRARLAFDADDALYADLFSLRLRVGDPDTLNLLIGLYDE